MYNYPIIQSTNYPIKSGLTHYVIARRDVPDGTSRRGNLNDGDCLAKPDPASQEEFDYWIITFNVPLDIV
ncbi:TPA: hypothetical protein DIS61_04585 [Patescibacteria group bacterium]|nr:hypothetical protein [Patescibacteria group bacterium]